MQYPSSKKYNLGYTPRGELRTLYDNLTPTHFEAYYIYDPSGNLLTRNLDQYQTHSSSLFDPQVNRLTQIQHFLNGSSPKYNYGYDKMGNRTYEQRDGVVADGYRYDANNQMTSFWYDGTTTGPATGDPLSTIVYDASGNRTSKVEDVTSTTYAAANNLNQYP
ncbi:MAG: hypothetical protein M3480_00560, partial [Verrucomicrobiota bacterium]|nr:hypothetical protein [Verrucomicrobiota bacterium]